MCLWLKSVVSKVRNDPSTRSMVPLMNLIHYEAIVKQVKRNVSQYYASQNIISSGFPQ
jgi:hypothetical protein